MLTSTTHVLMALPAILRLATVWTLYLFALVVCLLSCLIVYVWRFDGLVRVVEKVVARLVDAVGDGKGRVWAETRADDVVPTVLCRQGTSGLPSGSPERRNTGDRASSTWETPRKANTNAREASGSTASSSGTDRKDRNGRNERKVVMVEALRFGSGVVRKMDFGAGLRTSGVEVGQVGVWVPTWVQPLRLVVSNVRVCVACVDERGRRVDPSSKEASMAQARAEALQRSLRSSALSLIDEILWGTTATSASSSARPSLVQRLIGIVKSNVLYGVVKSVVRSVHVELRDVRVFYMQQGEPGPRPSVCKYSGRDAAELRVRTVVLQRGEGSLEADDGRDASDPSTSSTAGSSDRLNLSISGVSLDLLTYPDTWEMSEGTELPSTSSSSPSKASGALASFSFPKYTKMGTSPERKKMDRLKDTVVYEYLELSGDAGSSVLSRLTLADEEVHRVINQWEVSAVLTVLPPGVVRDWQSSQSPPSISHVDGDAFEDATEAMAELAASSDDDGDGLAGVSARASAAPRDRNARMRNSKSSSSSKFTLSLDVDVKALMLEVNLSSLGIADRLHGRLSMLSKYNAHWSVRPQVPVISNEMSWWHHVGRAAVDEVLRLVRWQGPLGSNAINGIEQRRANRLAYEPLYVSKYSRNVMFRDPNRRWYQRNTVTAADDAGMRALARLEERLSVEEVGHFRFMAAAKYNQVLASSSDLKELVATKVDFIISQLRRGRPIPRDVLLHLDCIPEPERAFGLVVSVDCPKVSVALDTRPHATAEASSASYFVCNLKHLYAGWMLGGAAKVIVRSMSMGPSESPTSELKFVTMNSPSQLCARVCKAADFTRYAVSGHVRAEDMAMELDAPFVNIELKPRLGAGGVTVDSCSGGGSGNIDIADRIKGWRPAGLEVRVVVAAIGAKLTALAEEDVDSDYSRVLVRHIGRYSRAETYLRRWNRGAEPFVIGGTNGRMPSAVTSASLGPSSTLNAPGVKRSAARRYPMLSERAPSMAVLVEDACARSLTPTISVTGLSTSNVRVECPGIAFQVPYHYRYSLSQEYALAIMKAGQPAESVATRTQSITSTVPSSEFEGSKYMLTVVVQNIRFSSFTESFAGYYGKGAMQMAEGGFMLDLFSYLSDEERDAISQKLAPMKYLFDEDTREFRQIASGVNQLKRKLQHLEIVSMAKCWAYPEDAAIIADAARPRTPSFDMVGEQKVSVNDPGSEEVRVPAIEVLKRCRYPVPIVPYFKTYGTLGSVASRVSGMPLVPGAKSTSAGVYVRNIHAWLSPIQLGHLKCLTETIETKFKNAGDDFRASSASAGRTLEILDASTLPDSGGSADAGGGHPDDGDDDDDEQVSSSSRQLLRVKVHVQSFSVIWMIGTWANRGVKRGNTFLARKSWGITVDKADPAYIWGQWLAPLYSLSISGLKTSLKNDMSGLAVKGSVRAVIAKDLQLSDVARHAYVLRPLPVRASRVFDSATSIRREALGLVHVRKAIQLWRIGIAVSMMRQAVDIGESDELLTQLPSFDDASLDSAGSQFKLNYNSGSRSGDGRARLDIDVGQMLAYIRIKQNASVNAFLGQVSGPGGSPDVDENQKAEKKQTGSSTKKQSYQKGLKVVVNMVGLDFTGRFQSEDLFSMRLQQGYLAVDQKPVSKYSNPEDIKMHMSAKVDNLMLCDLRASEEHQFVLSPSYDARSCAVTVHMTTQVDGSRFAPRLSIDVSNPRIILLFRFLRDVLDGVELVNASLDKAEPAGGGRAKTSDGHKRSSHEVANANANAGDSDAIAHANHGRDSAAAELPPALPMKMTINVHDVDLIVPTSRKERSVISVSMRELVLALPGTAMPASTLENAELPELDVLVEESVVCSSTFLYGNFTREKAKRHQATKDEDLSRAEDGTAEEILSKPDVADEDDVPAADRSQPERTRRSKKRRGKIKNPDTLTGVLLFEDQYDMRASDNTKAGVLQLPDDETGGFDINVVQDLHDDNVLKRSVTDNMLLAKPYEILESAFNKATGVKPAGENPGASVLLNADPHGDPALDEEGKETQHEDIHVEDVSEPSLAMCISEMKIKSGVMVALPVAELGDSAEGLARTGTLQRVLQGRQTFVLYDVVDHFQLIEPINLAMAMFERNSHSQLHLSLSEFRMVLSNPVYGTIMDFVGGNLGDFSGSSDDGILRFKEIRCNKGMKFGPIDSSNVGFRFTLATPEIDCIMSAPPTEWMGDVSDYFSDSFSFSESTALPFFNVRIANFIMNMASMDSADTYMNFCSTRIDMYDLRLGYRLHKISSDIAAGDSRAASPVPDLHEGTDAEVFSPSTTKTTVARKISDHSVKHRDSLQHVDLHSGARVRVDEHVADIRSQNFGVPLIDFTRNGAFESIIGDDVACYRLLTTDVTLKDREHVDSLPGSNRNIRFEASVGILSDSTTAVEVALSGALIQYPYFHDTSLINGIAGIFKLTGGSDEEEANLDPHGAMFSDISSWLYLNVLITDTEVFVPVVDVDIALKLVDELWQYAPDLRLSEFEKVADVMLATALVHSSDSSALLSLEDRGISLDLALLRFCYASGGDGEIKMSTDLVNVAALLRDPHARVHTVVQPMSASFDLSMQQPESVERHEYQKMTHAAIVIQRAWRQHYLQTRTSAKLGEALKYLDGTGGGDGFDGIDGIDGSANDESNPGRHSQWKLVEKLALDVATPRTRELLEDYYAGKGQIGAMSRSVTKALSVKSINARLGVFTCRVAFSHVAFWKMASDGISVLTRQVPTGVEEIPVEVEFRPSGVQVGVSFERLAFVLCNDKPETFGAPDVLNLCLSDGEASLDMASLLPDRPPNSVGNVSVTLFSSFLNSGSSKWEPMLSPWPLRAEFVDANGSGFASDRKIFFWLTSEMMMESTFNPASLMSVGDLLSLVQMMQSPEMPMLAYREGSSFDDMDATAKMMYTKGSASRAPQKYLIQNQSGLKLYYWTEDATKANKKSPVISLDPEASDTLKVVPCNKKLTLMNFTASATGTERLGAVINLHFEGNWMPIRDVPINVVGKYKYNMTSPADNTVMPVVVDVILVGRTKIITVHSGIWVENSIEIPISFRLHVPTTSLVPPGVIKRRQKLSTEGDVLVGPLRPGEGVYLPLVASLGGLLFLQPSDYQEATRDVIRLSINVADLVNQQGHIVCNSLDLPGVDEQPLHVTMEVIPSKVLSEFQTFKHMEVVGPGTLQRAISPLEVTISIQPTMVFNNAMPYGMNVLLWQIGVSEDKMGGTDFMDMLSPRASRAHVPRPETEGRYFAFHVPAGGEASIYADVRRDILAHVSFEEVNMRTTKWTLCNPSWTPKVHLKERLERLPAVIPLRMLDVGLELPTEAFGIEQYLERLKIGLSKLRSVHAQLKRNARKAVTARDVSRQVARIKSMAKRKGKSKTKRSKSARAASAPPQTVKRAPPTSARPIPPQPQDIPASSPPSNFVDNPVFDETLTKTVKFVPATKDSGVRKNKRKGLLRQLFGKGEAATTPPRSPGATELSPSSTGGGAEEAVVDLQVDVSAAEITPFSEGGVPASPYQDAPGMSPLPSSSRGVHTPEYVAFRPPPLNVEVESDSSEESQGSSAEDNRMAAPAILNVRMQTSLADKDFSSVSRVTFFVPFWLNNRTGVDLFFKDSEASSHPLGFALPWEYLEVFVPGTSLTEDMDRAHDRLNNSAGESIDAILGEKGHPTSSQVVLMNQQEDLALGLAHVSNRKYSQPVGIKTVGNKGTVELKGPVYNAKALKSRDAAVTTRYTSDTESPEEPSPLSPIASPTDETEVDIGINAHPDAGMQAIGAMKVAAAATTRSNSAGDDPQFPDERGVKLSKFTNRSFEFAVDVSAAPRKSMFRNTKLINLKPKYIIENQTGIAVDIKQYGTADPGGELETSDEGHRKFARLLPHGSRTAVYWDDTQLPREVTIRPRLEDEDPGDWNWSGAFPLPETEWYFGLRVRHASNQRRYVNIPVNVTVGSSGSIQVTLKKPTGVPPYRIENLCKDVQLFFVQVPLVFRADGKQYVDCLNPKEVMAYAWDEPTLLPKLRVQAKFSGRQESRVADYALDVLGDAATLLLPTQEEKEEQTAGKLYRSLSNEMPDELKQKLVSLLAAEFSKKVYATVYADGPTRVLRFSDDRNVLSSEHKHVVLDLAYRLKQIEYQMRDVNGQFARLGGMQGHHYFTGLDLYGRFKDDVVTEEDRSRALVTKTLRKMPVPESTQQFVRQASKQVFAHSRSHSYEDLEINPADLQDEADSTTTTPGKQMGVRFLGDTPVSTSKYSGTVHTVSEGGDSVREPFEHERFSPQGSVSRIERNDTLRDVGHLEGGDSFMPRKSARRLATFHSSQSTMNINKRQELLKGLIVGDANLLVGGDLNITVVQAQNLSGTQRSTHSFARVRVRDAIPPAEDADRSKQTSVVWQSLDPIWDEQLVFKDVCVASELVVELWDLGGTRPSNQFIHPDTTEVIKTCRFLGRAEIPLTETLDVPAMTALWYPLMRRTAGDEITGRLQLRFHWDVSTRGLMSIKLLALESVLAQRREILAALQPVESLESLAWAKVNPETFATTDGTGGQSKQVMPTIGQEMFRIRGEDNFSTLTFNPSESSIAVMNRHAHNHRQRHLVVTVLEARGLNPRSGVVVALADNELPNPVVSVQLDGYPSYSTEALSHTLNPRWPANQRHIFRGVDPAKAELVITISDERKGVMRRSIPLGRGVVHASNLKGNRPTYIWVPAYAITKKKKLAGAASLDEHTIPDLQVFLRLQWQRKVDRGSSTKLEMDLAGAGIMVVGGLQDELFNLTLESLKLESITASHERVIQGTVSSIQLDNQTLNAGEPVVLAPDAGLRPTVQQRPLVKFFLAQTFGASVEMSMMEKDVKRVEGCDKVSRKIGKGEEKGADIRSYKKFSLSIDPLHLQTDEVFMEQLLSFVSSIPTADIWQDETWQDQQYRLLTAQFGPREVEALAINAPMVAQNSAMGSNGRPRGSADNLSAVALGDNKALMWVREKENQDLMALQGQSNLSSWFFIESAEIGRIKVNVSISLSSRVLAAGGIGGEEDEFSRALGASGYQLVNVSKVEISLGKWLLGNDPSFRGKRTADGFLSQRALISNLSRHYTREGLKEAHKVLGGSGPAVASVPLAVLWAGGSAVVLVHEAALGKAGPVGVAKQVFYLPIMTVSMFFSGFSRMFAAGMAVLPPERIHGDSETVRRLVQRPTNAIDALVYMPKELLYGFAAAGQGILYDPIAGWHNGHVPGFLVGLAKGIIGVPVRPIIGICEATSDLTGAIAMASLGREGIVGRTLRRVKAPGAFLEETIASLDVDGIDESPMTGIVAAWQRALLEFFPDMVGEEVTQVMNVRPTRVLLFTTNFVAYLKAKHLMEHSVYSPKWVIPAFEIQNIQGDAESRKISITHVRKFDLKVFGVWPIQMRKGLRCENRSLFDRTVLRLTKVQQAAQTGRPIDDGGKKYRVPQVHELTVLSNPYKPPTSRKTVRIQEISRSID